MSKFDELMGFLESPKDEVEAFTTSLPIPRLYDAKDIKDTGKGKIVKLYDYTRKIYGQDIAQVQAIGDCVSFGYAHAIDYTNCFEIANGDLEEFKVLTATEYIYGHSRVQIGNGALGNSDGSYGIWGAKSVVQGSVYRQAYDKYDLTVYSGSRAKSWGSSGVPTELIEIAKQFPVNTITRITSYNEARDAIANGYAISTCSNQGFTTKRDANGICRPYARWPHCMAIIGVDDTKGLVCILNSWGKYMSGPTYLDSPQEAFWITGEVLEKTMLPVGETYAISDKVGFPLKKIKIRW